MRPWFAIATKRNEEFTALQELTKQGIKALVPHRMRTVKHARKVLTKPRPLFPGYALAQIDFQETPMYSVNATRGVKGVLCSASNSPAAIRHHIIEALLAACDGSGLLTPPQNLLAGDRIQFSSGPLQDLLGTIEKVSGNDSIWVILDTESIASRIMTNTEKILKVEN